MTDSDSMATRHSRTFRFHPWTLLLSCCDNIWSGALLLANFVLIRVDITFGSGLGGLNDFNAVNALNDGTSDSDSESDSCSDSGPERQGGGSDRDDDASSDTADAATTDSDDQSDARFHLSLGRAAITLDDSESEVSPVALDFQPIRPGAATSTIRTFFFRWCTE